MGRIILMFPNYSYPPGVMAGVICDALLGRRRDFREDGRASVGRIVPPVYVLGEEPIPQDGPWVIMVNHYSRPGASCLAAGSPRIALCTGASL